MEESETITGSGTDRLLKPILYYCRRRLRRKPTLPKSHVICNHHVIQHDFDVMFIATNVLDEANRVERKITPLNREMSGLILPHNHHGRHSEERGTVTGTELEENKFGFVGRNLAEIWSNLIIDNYSNVAEYIEPAISEFMEKNLSSREQNYVVGYPHAIKLILKADREIL